MKADNPGASVHIVGAGLIGASIGVGLTAEGWPVTIDDRDAKAAKLARDIGAGGVRASDDAPDLVVVAVPPAAAADAVVSALRAWPEAVVTDVASVKEPIARAVEATSQGRRYVGSHPMAGREVSGGLAAQGDLFRARPWVLCPNGASASAQALVRAAAEALGGDVVVMDAARHDAAVARTSHAPQVAASAVAAALAGLDPEDVALSGQGLRDVTRIAASEPEMWADIARLNEGHLRETLRHIIGDLEKVREATDAGAALGALIERGRKEVARIPGKHGDKRREWSDVVVIVPDEPGELLRLLTAVAEEYVNVEDLAIEHSPKQPVGLVRVSVLASRAEPLIKALQAEGWEVASS
jgi:prephenate dehydrogenase